jgi:RND family efflux transporter MFP subunit
MSLRALLVVLVVVAASTFAVNAYLAPVPGLEWARSGSGGATGGSGPTAGADPAAVEGRSATSGRGERGGRGGGRGGGRDGPAPVTIATAEVADVPVYLRGVGTARALATVTVKPQVDGRLLKVHFKEGQEVSRGDLLAEIDSATYRAQLDQAIAKRRLTEVQLANAKVDLERLTSVGSGVVTQKSVDTQRAQVAQFEAQIKADAAAVANAEAILGYTRIVSPLTGRTGQRLVDEGNLMRAGDAGIVTIAQLKPISVQFTLPQQQLREVKTASDRGPVPVEALAADDRTVIDSGPLAFIDNQVDQTTGTVRMKADLPNASMQLWPGQFVNVRMQVDTLRGIVTVPTAAVQRGPTGPFVFVVGEAKRGKGEMVETVVGEAAPAASMPSATNPAGGGATSPAGAANAAEAPDGASEAGGRKRGPKMVVAIRPVTVARQDERVAAISAGLAAGERIVTSGFARLKDGSEVAPAEQQGQPAADPAVPQAEGKPKGERRRRAEGEPVGAAGGGRPNPSVVQ